MSATADRTTGGMRGDLALLGLAVIAGLALLLYFASQKQQALRASPVGFDGLQVWLNAEGVSTRSFTGGWTLDPGEIGLVVQPLYDTRLDETRAVPRSEEELLLQADEYDLTAEVISAKAYDVWSLVVLPKWRSGMRLTGIAHPVLLDDATALSGIVRRLTGDEAAEVAHVPEPFVDFDYDDEETGLTARLYVPQVFSSAACEPVIGTAAAMVLGFCEEPTTEGFYLLSDPDLINNHGLRLADNAAIAVDVFDRLAAGDTVLIDYSARNWFATDAEPDSYDRSWADFKRFFAYPFLTLWLAAGAMLALLLWRAGRRYGPLLAGAEGPGSAKALAIRARARLMRLTDQDGALVGDYARARVAALGARLFGPAHGMDARALDRSLARAFPEPHAELASALAAIGALPAKTAASDAIAYVTTLEKILEKFDNEPR